jgi:hypothetical protein
MAQKASGLQNAAPTFWVMIICLSRLSHLSPSHSRCPFDTKPLYRHMNILRKADLAYRPEDPDEFMKKIKMRGDWRSIPLFTLLEISKNARGNYDEVYNFVHISEIANLVKDRYIPVCNEPQPRFPASVSFGIVLSLEGINVLRQFYDCLLSNDGRKSQAAQASRICDMMFMASVLCDPLQINSYAYWANLYAYRQKNVALEFCDKFFKFRELLLSAPDNCLSAYHQTVKVDLMNPDAISDFFAKVSSMGLSSPLENQSQSITQLVQNLSIALQTADFEAPSREDMDNLLNAIYAML